MALSEIAERLEEADPALARYNRQMLWAPIGVEGQKKLQQSRVLLVGCGALGTVLANTLCRAGVGHMTIIDRDFIEINNLQRQVLFDQQDIAHQLPKAVAAQRKIARINSEIHVEAVVADVNHGNIEQYARDKHLLLDGTDNFETRFLINDVSIKLNIPWIYGACISAMGLAMVIRPGITPCLRCIFETSPPAGMNPTCDTAGVLGPTVNVVASWQSMEAIKLLTGNIEALNPRLFSFDLWDNRFQQLNVSRAREIADCPACKHRNFEYLSGKFGSSTTTLCGRNAVQISQPAGHRVDFAQIAENLKAVGNPNFNKFMLKCGIVEGQGDNKKVYELTLFSDGRAIIKGTNDAAVAKAVYAKYVGS
ncbi:MAG TPA: ThiF family adenylyltransferase [Phycisphaerae bacterium]|nr:ThiF family adenylyltransferase [Phycisphaerae bacterium]